VQIRFEKSASPPDPVRVRLDEDWASVKCNQPSLIFSHIFEKGSFYGSYLILTQQEASGRVSFAAHLRSAKENIGAALAVACGAGFCSMTAL